MAHPPKSGRPEDAPAVDSSVSSPPSTPDASAVRRPPSASSDTVEGTIVVEPNVVEPTVVEPTVVEPNVVEPNVVEHRDLADVAEAMPIPESFDALALPDALREAVTELGWTKPTPVQAHSFDLVVAGADVLVQSQTGTGKTGAFCLPWLAARFVPGPAAETGVQLLVLTPTRELAKQVCDQLVTLAKQSPVVPLPIYGGTAMQPQLTALKQGVHAVVGTPGRILDHIRRRTLDLSTVRMVVLDEADEMLSMGFLEDIHAILEACPLDRQTTLFSATVPPDIERIARRYMRDPVPVLLSGDQVAAAEIHHTYYTVSGTMRTRDLLDVVAVEEPSTALVFCNTREETNVVASVLRRAGYGAEALSSDLTQTARERVLGLMRAGRLRFLVATDVASRGIDISHISHVINFTFPENAESYIHRTGRTGRAGRPGQALSLVAPQELGNFYYLKLQYPTLQFEERQLPPAEELEAQRTETRLDQICRALPELVGPEWALLVRRLNADPRGEQVLAFALSEAITRAESRRGSSESADVAELDGRRERKRDSPRFGGGDERRGGRSARGRSDRRDDETRPGPSSEAFGRRSSGPRDERSAEAGERPRRSRDERSAEAGERPRRSRDARHRGDGQRSEGAPDAVDRPGRDRSEAARDEGPAVTAGTAPADNADAPLETSEEGLPVSEATLTDGGTGRARGRRRRRGRRGGASRDASLSHPGEDAQRGPSVEASAVMFDEHARSSLEQPDSGALQGIENALADTDDGSEAAGPTVADEATAAIADPAPVDAGSRVDGDGRRRRRRRRGPKPDGAPSPAPPVRARPSPEAADTDTLPDGETGEGRARRRRRRGRRRPPGPVAESTAPPLPAQDRIVIDIDEDELEIVRDEFGEIDELDDLTLKGRRRNVMDALQEEVELEDLSARDEADRTADATDAEGSEPADQSTQGASELAEGDDEDSDADAEAEAEAEADSDIAATDADDEDRKKAKRRRRRRRKKKTEAPPPELTAPPHKDFWEVWAAKFTYEQFEDHNFLDASELEAEAEASRPPPPQPPARTAFAKAAEQVDDQPFTAVRLNIGRKHGKKAAHIRELLASRLKIGGRGIRNLTVGDASTRLSVTENDAHRMVAHLTGFTVDAMSLEVTLLDPPADDDDSETDAKADAQAAEQRALDPAGEDTAAGEEEAPAEFAEAGELGVSESSGPPVPS